MACVRVGEIHDGGGESGLLFPISSQRLHIRLRAIGAYPLPQEYCEMSANLIPDLEQSTFQFPDSSLLEPCLRRLLERLHLFIFLGSSFSPVKRIIKSSASFEHTTRSSYSS